MQLSKDLVMKFQGLHLEKCGVEISYNVAESQLKELAELVRLTSRGQEDEPNA
jgi:hypothetical protein